MAGWVMAGARAPCRSADISCRAYALRRFAAARYRPARPRAHAPA